MTKSIEKRKIRRSAESDITAESSVKGVIFDIKRYAIHDGPGIRTTVFFKGCPLSCKWCHNPESWSADPEPGLRLTRCVKCGRCVEVCANHATVLTDGKLVIDPGKCTLCGDCVNVCLANAREIIGREVTAKEVFKKIQKDIVFYDQSGGGATFSGGEPLMQPDFLLELLLGCKREKIHTAVDTTCYVKEDIIKRFSDNADLFLCDIKHMDSRVHQEFTSVPNKLILKNIQWLASAGKKIIIRLPIIPGFNDSPANIDETAKFAKSLKTVVQIDLLPYNSGGLEKVNRLTGNYMLMRTKPPSGEQIADIAGRIKGFGFNVEIDGDLFKSILVFPKIDK